MPLTELNYEADLEALRGDVGPCDYFDCDERAAQKVLITLGGVHVTAYCCDEHAEMLVEGIPVCG